uniref:DNA-directed RNA polymerase n=1 Tax=Glaukea argentea TaxID=2894057 RepID=A0A386B1K7_9CHLO|nr:RNA polymerase b-subunit [Udotea argentea]AYC65537.1 RNA polymerase b-subunit [Udotea argentea]
MKYQLTPTIFFNHCFNKRRFNSFLHWFFRKSHHGHYRLLKFLEKIKLLGFHSATEAGFSISIDDLKIPVSKSSVLLTAENEVFDTDSQFRAGNLTIIEHYQCILEVWNRTSEELKYEVLQSFKFSDFLNPVYFMAFSGARGNISQIRQLVGMRGLMADPQGQIIDFPIRSSFREGLTLTEYLISCSGARKGVVDTALRTAASGYLTRRLVDVAHQVIISQIDCHDSQGIFIEDLYDDRQKKILPLKQRLVGRILAETIICPSKHFIIGSKNQEISKQISSRICKIRQKVQIRSPLTCKSSKFICQFCYGWNLAEGQLVSIGEAVGILAAQSIGEPGTQLTMRTFHTGGVFTGILLNQTYTPFAGRIHYLSLCSGLLIRTQHGKIAYLSKNNGILQIKKSLTVQKKIQLSFQSGSLLYVKQGENVFKKQLIAELPFFKEEENEFKNEQKVSSLNSGEMYFENFLLLEKTRFDFLKQQTKNPIQGFDEFWILSAQFFKKTNSFFHYLDLVDKLIPCTQVRLNLQHSHKFSRRVFNIPIYSLFFKNSGYLCKPKQKVQISSIKFQTLTTGLKLRKITTHFHRKNWELTTLWPSLVSWRNKTKIIKYFINTSYNILYEFLFQTNKKYKQINQNLFIIFINRQGIPKYKTKKINLVQLTKKYSFTKLFSKNLVKNFYSNWIRQNFKVKPKILHWKNISISKYIFLIHLLEGISTINKVKSQYKFKILQQSKHYFYKFKKRRKFLKIGDNVYIRIFLCFSKNKKQLSQKSSQISLIKKYFKNLIFNKEIIYLKNRNKKYFSSNSLEWYFFGYKSKNTYSTYLKNFIKKKRSLPFQNNDFSIFPSLKKLVTAFDIKKESIFFLEEVLPYSMTSHSKISLIQTDLIKFQQKTINFYFDAYCFFLKNFYFLKNFKLRFTNKKLQKPILKFFNLQTDDKKIFQKNILKKYYRKRSEKLTFPNIKNFFKIQTNNYNKRVESISKKSFISLKNKIPNDFQKYKIRYLKSSIPEKKDYFPIFEKKLKKTFFIFFSYLKCWLFIINNRNSLYSVNRNSLYSVKRRTKYRKRKFFRTQKNLRFLLFNKIKIILNLKKVSKKKLKKKKLDFEIPSLNKEFDLALINILPVNFNFKLLNNTHSHKLQLIKVKYLNRNLFSKIANSYLQIIQKNFFCSIETQIIFRFFFFSTSSEILDPQIKKKYKNNILFTNTENYFSQKVLPIKKNKSSLNQKNREDRNQKKFCLSNNRFPIKKSLKRIPGLLFKGGEELLDDQFIFNGGQLIAKTYNTFLFRKATNYLLNEQSILYTRHGEIIFKNQHLCSVFYNQSKIGDIVQGIPKIEEILEARKKSIYNFQKLPSYVKFFEEIDQYLENLQKSILNNIQRIYCGQGIYISDKHIEIIVRQMTSHALILYPGQTKLLRGEVVSLQWIYKINEEYLKKIIYKPLFLGITKTCLKTSSFLSAASFQETTRVLSQAAIQNQIDFMRGLKQNVILGNLLPAGTGYF